MNQPKAPLWHATELVPSMLYVGNQHDAKQIDALRHFGIKIIINCALECKHKYDSRFPGQFTVVHLPLLDTVSETISESFDQTYRIIDEARQKGLGVLVHCVAGASRSPTICMAYLLRSSNRTLNDIYNEIVKKRRFVNPNIGFMKQLMSFEVRLRSIPQSTLTLSQKRTKKMLELSDNLCAFFDITFEDVPDIKWLEDNFRNSFTPSQDIRWVSFRQLAPNRIRALCTFSIQNDCHEIENRILKLSKITSCQLTNSSASKNRIKYDPI